jgi:hypothetical protein
MYVHLVLPGVYLTFINRTNDDDKARDLNELNDLSDEESAISSDSDSVDEHGADQEDITDDESQGNEPAVKDDENFHIADNIGLNDRTSTQNTPQINSHPSETPAIGSSIIPDDTNIQPDEDTTLADPPPARSGRKRKAKDLQAISDCLCGEPVTKDEISQATCVIQCKKPGCETLWVSRILF